MRLRSGRVDERVALDDDEIGSGEWYQYVLLRDKVNEPEGLSRRTAAGVTGPEGRLDDNTVEGYSPSPTKVPDGPAKVKSTSSTSCGSRGCRLPFRSHTPHPILGAEGVRRTGIGGNTWHSRGSARW
jgi:hypothetical protein